jgi:hypothetical protein
VEADIAAEKNTTAANAASAAAVNTTSAAAANATAANAAAEHDITESDTEMTASGIAPPMTS